MSNESYPQPQPSDEVDLGIMINAIGRAFDRFIRFIVSIFKGIFDVIIWASRAVIDNFKVIAVALIVAGLAGYAMEKYLPAKYESTMLVRTYFDAKYQLNTNMNYYNALLSEENYAALSNIFEVEEEVFDEIIEFELERGAETENQLIRQYDLFMKSLDSVRAQEVSYGDFIDNRDMLYGDLFQIRIEAKKIDLFKSLEEGIFRSFDNLYSIEKKRIRDSLISLRKANIQASLAVIDSLKNVYINVLEEESAATKASVNLGSIIPLQQEKTETKEFQLLNKEIELRAELSKLDQKKVEENVFFDVLSSFQAVGNKVKGWQNKYSILLPAAAFLILVLFFLTKEYTRFVRNYG